MSVVPSYIYLMQHSNKPLLFYFIPIFYGWFELSISPELVTLCGRNVRRVGLHFIFPFSGIAVRTPKVFIRKLWRDKGLINKHFLCVADLKENRARMTLEKKEHTQKKQCATSLWCPNCLKQCNFNEKIGPPLFYYVFHFRYSPFPLFAQFATQWISVCDRPVLFFCCWLVQNLCKLCDLILNHCIMFLTAESQLNQSRLARSKHPFADFSTGLGVKLSNS